ncbi:hypothetical protein RMSM_02918 [Rhodopirellula maiorica SM1]|uniref:SMODS-associated and fused to various effectors domain-containing protein n=1 Tax=Rhodopirellula maiorica SM1 TaxID=1265738 RepID=M5RLG8_9BACT|nr:hypothetical protein RMSM_02918 [Rhodopirellula maiorica SM1]
MLYRDKVTKAEFNQAYIAHIIADKPGGPRGDAVLSEKLRKELSNLMLLCDVHHRLVDKIDVDGHPAFRLEQMKRDHERRVATVTSIDRSRQSHLLFYGARIGEQGAPLTLANAKLAMMPNRYPANHEPIALGLKNSSFVDHEPDYWTFEIAHLRRQFAARVTPQLTEEIQHLSVFGLAPIPLLIELGRLLSDIPNVDVYQLHREPPGWQWHESTGELKFTTTQEGPSNATRVGLNLSLSANIANQRIRNVMGDDSCIWTVSAPKPGNDFLKSKEQLRAFRETMRATFDAIKLQHGEDAELSVFPAMPVSAAIEIGRVWMPKADLPFTVFDQNRSSGGFSPALTIFQSPR